MRHNRGKFARGGAIAGAALVGLSAANAFAADGTLKVEQGLQWSEQGGGVCFNGNVGGGEFGVYDFVNNSAQTLVPINAVAKVNATVNTIPGFTFQTFCLEPGVHIDFHVDLNFTINTQVQNLIGPPTNLDPRTAFLFSQFYLNGSALSPAYGYSPLGLTRSNSAKDMQLAIWFCEGKSAYGGGPTDNVDEYIAIANTETGVGGGWTALWGSTFPGNLGGVRALNIEHNGALQQDLLALFGEEPPPPPEGDCEGRTPGFWHNKNGGALVEESGAGADWTWLNTINALPLVDGTTNGHYLADVPISKNGWKTIADFLTSGNNAKNMAQKLSQHLCAMQFNVLSGLAGEDCLLYTGQNADCIPGSPSTVEVGVVIDLAIASLTSDPYTPDGDDQRDYQECLKNILESGNTNVGWVH